MSLDDGCGAGAALLARIRRLQKGRGRGPPANGGVGLSRCSAYSGSGPVTFVTLTYMPSSRSLLVASIVPGTFDAGRPRTPGLQFAPEAFQRTQPHVVDATVLSALKRP